MSLSKSKIAIVGAFGAGALALVGVGTGATFTQDVSASQQVQAGSMNVTLDSPVSGVTGGGTHTLTFPTTGPQNSTFDTGPQEFVMTNNGDIPVDAYYLKVSDDVTSASSAASKALQSQLFARVISDGAVLYDGPLSALESAGQIRVDGPIAVHGTDEGEIEFYAGAVPSLGSNACASTLLAGVCPAASAPSLTNDAEGGLVTPTLTLTYNG